MRHREDGSWALILVCICFLSIFILPLWTNDLCVNQGEFRESTTVCTRQWLQSIGPVLTSIASIVLTISIFVYGIRREELDRSKSLRIDLLGERVRLFAVKKAVIDFRHTLSIISIYERRPNKKESIARQAKYKCYESLAKSIDQYGHFDSSLIYKWNIESIVEVRSCAAGIITSFHAAENLPYSIQEVTMSHIQILVDQMMQSAESSISSIEKKLENIR